MNEVIKIENLYKEYKLGVIGHGTLYRDLQSFIAKLKGKEDPNSILGHEEKISQKSILAVNNINLDIYAGEIIGIIGANGAGKSTLLKLLSRVTGPSKGEIKIKGRVASLLEVGTGFHGELTGRENIYLNGAINGMNNREVTRKLDEIVDFAGIEQFLDTPVKRYSSGMHVRLGFSVAAHLDPDILIVDEVLAVGDISFRKKAAKKMEQVSKTSGINVLYVSHNMDSIKTLCNRSVLLSKGKIIADGQTPDVINEYTAHLDNIVSNYAGKRTWEKNTNPGNNNVKLLSISTKNLDNSVKPEFDVTEPFYLEYEYEVLKNNLQISSSIEFFNESGTLLFVLHDSYSYGEWGKQDPKKSGRYLSKFSIPKNIFQTGVITIGINIYLPPAAANNSIQLKEINVFSFKISDNYNSDSARGNYPYYWGEPAVRPKINNETRKI